MEKVQGLLSELNDVVGVSSTWDDDQQRGELKKVASRLSHIEKKLVELGYFEPVPTIRKAFFMLKGFV